jgi:hypothetical protein
MVGVESTLGKMFFYMHFNCGWVENEMGVSNQIGKLNEDKKMEGSIFGAKKGKNHLF